MSKSASTAFLLVAALAFVGGVGALVIARRQSPPTPPAVAVTRDPVEQARELSERMQEAMTTQGNLAQILPDAVTLAHKHPQCFEAQLLLGQLYIAQKCYDLAYGPVHAALELRPLGQELTKLLGTLAANSDRPKEAEELYRHALAKAPKSRERGMVHAMLGSMLRAQNKPDQADAEYALAVADDAYLAIAHVARADLALSQNKIQDALARVEEGETWAGPADKAPFDLMKARILLAQKQPDEAYRLLMTNLEAKERLTLSAAAVLAQIFEAQNKPAKAAAHYEAVAAALEAPPAPDAKPNLEDAKAKQAQVEEARALAAAWWKKAGR